VTKKELKQELIEAIEAKERAERRTCLYYNRVDELRCYNRDLRVQNANQDTAINTLQLEISRLKTELSKQLMPNPN
jgi:hypothetical protein